MSPAIGCGGTCSIPAACFHRQRLRTNGSTACWTFSSSRSVADAPVAALPLGVLRLVEVGRALATDPHVLLLDEPLSGLDMKASENLLSVFRHIIEQSDHQLSLVIVEHDVAAVLAMSDTVFVLNFGECIATGSPEEVRSDPAVRAAYLGDSEPIRRSRLDTPGRRAGRSSTGWGTEHMTDPLLQVRISTFSTEDRKRCSASRST